MYKKEARTFRLFNVNDGMLIIDCIGSTAYTFFTNPTENHHLGTISLFARNFLGKPRKVTRKQNSWFFDNSQFFPNKLLVYNKYRGHSA